MIVNRRFPKIDPCGLPPCTLRGEDMEEAAYYFPARVAGTMTIQSTQAGIVAQAVESFFKVKANDVRSGSGVF